ncbi:MAG: hypothetical protein RI897_4040, partial [Verrucomicrobiota bacterium]
ADIDEAGGDSPGEGHEAAGVCGGVPEFAHGALGVLDIVAVADEDGDVDLVFERGHFGDGRDGNLRARGGVDGRADEVVGGHGPDAEFGCGGDTGAFGGVPSESDGLAGFHVAEELSHQGAFFGNPAIEPKDGCPGGGGHVAGVMVIASAVGGACAHDEAFGAVGPVVIVEVGVDFGGGLEGECGEVGAAVTGSAFFSPAMVPARLR